MAKYLLKRFGQMIVVILLVSICTFFLVDLVPGDPVYIYSGTEELSDEEYQKIAKDLNLDKSVFERYCIWFKGVLHGDFGKSYMNKTSVTELIKPRALTTLYMSIVALVVSVPLGIIFGILSAIFRKKWPDTLITLLANISNCLPQYWVGILFMYFLSYKVKIFPTMGIVWPSEGGLWAHIVSMVLPTICLSLSCIAGFTRQTRSSMLEVIRQDYVRTARSKGLSEKKVYFKHMMKNGLIPVITAIGSRFARLLGGSMVVEKVFAIPGLGALARTAVQSKDVPLIQAIVMLTAALTCISFLLTDFAYAAVDPRVSLSESGD